MPELTLPATGRTISFAPGQTLRDILLGGGEHIESPCGGKGTCGKCRVKVSGPGLPPPSEAERRFLSDAELEDGVRLACMAAPAGDVDVLLTEADRKGEVLTGGYVPDFERAPDTTKRAAVIERSTLREQLPYEDAVTRAFSLPEPWRADAGAPVLEGVVTGVFHAGRLIALEPGDTTGSVYGAAVDIGTTTMVVSVADLRTGETLADVSALNPQKKFGLDVLTRITYEIEHGEAGAGDLQKTLADEISALLAEACGSAGISVRSVYEICVAANCTMLHTLLGVDARPIGRAPYAPVFTSARTVPAASAGLRAAPGAVLYCLPSVSGYIGADITAGAYVCGLKNQPGRVLFIDIGTNGEIVLSDRGRLTSCSCAAGPALEGMNISSGMRAAEGAIEDIEIGPDGVSFKTIGGARPEGLCGSGILAAVSELLRLGIVRRDGAFVKPELLDEDDPRRRFIHTRDKKRSFIIVRGEHPIAVTQGDVRQVQLAKGAILSGFNALLDDAGIGTDELDSVIVAGQFGAHLSEDHLIGVGIIPEAVRGRVRYVGNTSRTGAYMALLSGRAKRGMEALAKEIGYIELSAAEGYERLFSSCLIFPERK